MSQHDPISDEQLNALLDNELDAGERDCILSALAQDPSLQQRYEQLRQLKYMLVSAYQNPPQPVTIPATGRPAQSRIRNTLTSAALLLVGLFGGWQIKHYVDAPVSVNFQYISNIDSANLVDDRILLHISTKDTTRVQAALQTAEKLLISSRNQQRPLTLKVVANSEGLNILRRGSPYAAKISALAAAYDNIKFLACGIAKQNVALKEGKPVVLIPEAKDIPAALEEILTRLEEGWTYIRG